jgi:peptidoglycan/LPS O-acetylase OafA/YrhL
MEPWQLELQQCRKCGGLSQGWNMAATDIAREALAEQTALSSKRHFEILDGLRGVAAIAVMLFHSFAGGGLFPNAPLAVDLFFLLSGFVIAYSSDDRLREGMPVSQFLLRRFIRLYPMVLVGALGGIAIALIHNKTNTEHFYPLRAIMMSGGLSLLLLPYLPALVNPKASPSAIINDDVFSFNPPLWSLFFELIANALYALFAKRLSTPILTLIVLFGLVGIGFGGELGGQNKSDILLGVPRVVAGYFGGVLLYQLWKRSWLPHLNGNFLVLSVILVALFMFPREIGGWLFIPAFAVMSAVIAFGVGAKPSRLDQYCALLGQISYPLYALHWLTLYVFTWLGKKVGLTGDHYNVVVISHSLGALVIAYLVMRFYETPVRLYLSWKFLQRQRNVLFS